MRVAVSCVGARSRAKAVLDFMVVHSELHAVFRTCRDVGGSFSRRDLRDFLLKSVCNWMNRCVNVSKFENLCDWIYQKSGCLAESLVFRDLQIFWIYGSVRVGQTFVDPEIREFVDARI